MFLTLWLLATLSQMRKAGRKFLKQLNNQGRGCKCCFRIQMNARRRTVFVWLTYIQYVKAAQLLGCMTDMVSDSMFPWLTLSMDPVQGQLGHLPIGISLWRRVLILNILIEYKGLCGNGKEWTGYAIFLRPWAAGVRACVAKRMATSSLGLTHALQQHSRVQFKGRRMG